VGTHVLPFAVPGRQHSEAAFPGFGIPRRHLADGFQQATDGLESLRRCPRTIDRNLLADAAVKDVLERHHCPRSYAEEKSANVGAARSAAGATVVDWNHAQRSYNWNNDAAPLRAPGNFPDRRVQAP